MQVVIIGRTAVGIGVQCDDPKCTWDSVPFMQRNYTSGHRQLMLDCLEVTESQPSQQHTQVMIVQRQLAHGRSMLNVLEVQEALQAAGAQVKVFSTQGKLFGCIYALHLVCTGVGAQVKVFSTLGSSAAPFACIQCVHGHGWRIEQEHA